MLAPSSVVSAGSGGGGTIPIVTKQDIYNWTGSQAIPGAAPGTFQNILALVGLALAAGGTAGTTIVGTELKFPAVAQKTLVNISFRIAGTIAGAAGTAREWKMQTRRPDGTTIVGSDSDVKVSGADISNRDTTLVTFTDGVADPFSVAGIQVGLFNDSAQILTLTSVRLLVQRIG